MKTEAESQTAHRQSLIRTVSTMRFECTGVSLCALVLFAIFLAACAAPTTPVPTATPAPTVTATLPPSASPTLTPPPTATATLIPSTTPTLTLPPTATATRAATATLTRTAAEASAATLRALPGYAWQAKGDVIRLTDAKGAAVATLDTAADGVRWTGDFTLLDHYIKADATLDRVAFTEFLQNLEAQGRSFCHN